MKLNINKEQLMVIGQYGLKIGKSIVIEGTKAVLIKGATAAIMTSFDDGFEGVKNLKLDDYLAGKKQNAKDNKVAELLRENQELKQQIEDVK